jgi:hypothetical protein
VCSYLSLPAPVFRDEREMEEGDFTEAGTRVLSKTDDFLQRIER